MNAGVPGPELFVKLAHGSEAVGRLRNQADLLRHVAHPNVVEVIEWRASNDVGELHLGIVDGTVMSQTTLDLARLIRVATSLATTVHHIHSRGVVHGAIRPEHIIVTTTDRIVLCGFGAARRSVGDDDWADDVLAIGQLIDRELGSDRSRVRVRTDEDPAHETRSEARRLLRDAARRASCNDRRARPSALDLAEVLRGISPASHSRRRQTFDAAPRAAARSARARRSIAALTGVVSALLLLSLWASSERWPPADESRSDENVEAGVTADCPIRQGLIANDPDSNTVVDVDGDGCFESMTSDHGIVTVGNERYALGTPTDVIVVGRWSCQPVQTIAMLRPGTGEVFRFDSWPAEGRSSTAHRVAIVEHATDLIVTPRGACDDLAVSVGREVVPIAIGAEA